MRIEFATPRSIPFAKFGVRHEVVVTDEL